MADRYQSFAEFWPFYLSEHRHPRTRLVHIAGTGIGLLCVLVGALGFNVLTILLGFAVGYGLAWLAHYKIEKNQPATFTYPLWSLLGDLKMFWLWCTGRLEAELIAHDIRDPEPPAII